MELQSTVLFLTNSELGQANVHLAVAHEFLLRPWNHAVHIASFVPLRSHVDYLNDHVFEYTSSTSPVGMATFHIIDGPSMSEMHKHHRDFDHFNVHQIGFCGALKAYKKVLPVLMSLWNGPKYMDVFHDCARIMDQIQPDIVVVDPLFYQAIDACRMFRPNSYVVLSPNTFKEHSPQPKLANLWKYSAMCSGYLFPLPWHLVLPNTILIFALIRALKTHAGYKRLEEHRNKYGIPGPVPTLMNAPGDFTPHLLPGVPEAEFPHVIPRHFHLCGPIVRPTIPISVDNPVLAKWLAQRPTLLINLGSHVTMDPATQKQFAVALRALLDKRSDLQVLWKMKLGADTELDMKNIAEIAQEVRSGRVRIEQWLNSEPFCILKSGNVIAVVHHGGANSYYECIKSGVPQIVLPVWFDNYDFAARVEWLGIGVWASRKSAPHVNARELGRALIHVLCSDDTFPMKHKAKAIGTKVNGRMEGRVVACEKIIEMVNCRMLTDQLENLAQTRSLEHRASADEFV